MRRKARIDANQVEVVKAFRALGCKVQSLAALGSGVPDLLLNINGVNVLAEVKDGSKPPSARRLTEDQIRWRAGWSGMIWTIESLEHVAECVKFYSYG